MRRRNRQVYREMEEALALKNDLLAALTSAAEKAITELEYRQGRIEALELSNEVYLRENKRVVGFFANAQQVLMDQGEALGMLQAEYDDLVVQLNDVLLEADEELFA